MLTARSVNATRISMDSWSARPGVWLGLGLLLVAVGSVLAHWVATLRARYRGRLHNLRGQRGERDALRLLRRAGYTLVARQQRGHYAVQIDDTVAEVQLQADFVVARGGRRLVAEVKTGLHAPRFEHAETRRQLLEYQLAFEVDAVLLVDVEAGAVKEVRFPVARAIADRRAHVLGWLLAAALAATLVGVLVR
jgi:Holliday junction resolvase